MARRLVYPWAVTTIPLDELDAFGLDAPITEVASSDSFAPPSELGASRHRHTFEGGRHLDALLINQGSDTLIVTFHGAANRDTWQLPRFERLQSTTPLGHSMLFLSDPALFIDYHVALAWYTGWEGVDLQPVLADWALRAARSVGANRIIFTGSSGGGFAALQVSALVPNSLCVPFNPQTSVYGYLEGGTRYSAQRAYVEWLRPEFAPEGIWKIDWSKDWTASLGDEMSALRRYSHPVGNFVLYADNPNDFHHEQHMVPLAQVMDDSGNSDRFRIHSYDGPDGHNSPGSAVFNAVMGEALEWSRELPPTLS